MTYTISGYTFKTVKPVATTNVKFFSQKQLFAMGTPEAQAELKRRAEILNA